MKRLTTALIAAIIVVAGFSGVAEAYRGSGRIDDQGQTEHRGSGR